MSCPDPTRNRTYLAAIAVAWFLSLVLVDHSSAQEKSVRPGINSRFVDPDVNYFVERFEREGREVYDHRQRIIDDCDFRSGMTVADIGSGTGLFTKLLAKQVGEKGRVYAVDIAKKFVLHVETSCQKDGIKNVKGVVCTGTSTNLPPRSIDRAFICDTYHHFEYPRKTLRSLHRALRVGGQIVVVDFKRIEGESSKWILGHVRAGQKTVTDEIVAAGFKPLEEPTKPYFKDSYFLRFEKIESTGDATISKGTKNDEGFLVHNVRSAYQGTNTTIRVLLPENVSPSKELPVVFVLPVEPGLENRYGDGLAEVKRLGLHNRYQVIVVSPSFAQWPWYADHPSDDNVRQESYFLKVVVPMVDAYYPTQADSSSRHLIGFSKSGWGAMSLLLRNPDQFGRIAAWDAPLAMQWPSKYGSAKIFETKENFERYSVTSLIRRNGKLFQKPPLQQDSVKRIALLGYGGLRQDHQTMHRLLDELDIDHQYRDGPSRKHVWTSGWVSEAFQFVMQREKQSTPQKSTQQQSTQQKGKTN